MKGLLILFFPVLVSANSIRHGLFTPLKNDEHPCIAENLKETHRYLCDDDANVICLTGWREPEDEDLLDLRNPCPIPICEYENRTCAHGECVRPDVCACKVGWEGHLCEQCLTLPGCEHGTCENAFECNCICDENGDPLYEGAFCDKPACPDCDPEHGRCYEPHVCTCYEGWTGTDCKTCIKLSGCVNGDCDNDRPGTCKCRPGWKGPLCDIPICREGCHEYHGYCEEPDTCLCKTGWEGRTCEDCVPYWLCPSSGQCIEPNQCICDASARAADTHKVCNKNYINGPEHGNFGKCSNPCREDERVIAPVGSKTSKCRWSADNNCTNIVEDCFGDKDWSIVDSGSSDIANCVISREDASSLQDGFQLHTTSPPAPSKPATAAPAGTSSEPGTPPPTPPATTPPPAIAK